MIEKYEHEKHYRHVSAWLRAYGMAVPAKELFSDLGLVIDDIAIGFLFLGGNSKQAYIDNIVANPFTTAERRDEALTTLLEKLEETAKDKGYLLIQVLAPIIRIPSQRARLESLGYKQHDDYTLYYRIPGGA